MKQPHLSGLNSEQDWFNLDFWIGTSQNDFDINVKAWLLFETSIFYIREKRKTKKFSISSLEKKNAQTSHRIENNTTETRSNCIENI